MHAFLTYTDKEFSACFEFKKINAVYQYLRVGKEIIDIVVRNPLIEYADVGQRIDALNHLA